MYLVGVWAETAAATATVIVTEIPRWTETLSSRSRSKMKMISIRMMRMKMKMKSPTLMKIC